MLFVFCGLVVSGLWAPIVSHAAVYKFVDSQGTIHFSDYRRTASYEVLVKKLANHKSAINQAIKIVAKRYQMNRALLQAVIHTESSYQI
jgi:soluble lytic murein transglycosylase-like protein